MNGLKILSFIHLAIFFIPSLIPFKIPFGMLPPHSSIFFLKYFCAPLTASPIKPPRSAASPPNAAPISSNTLFAIPVQSMFSKNFSMPFTALSHFTFSIAVIAKSNIPLIPFESVFPAFAQSNVSNRPFIASARAFPAFFHLKFVTAMYTASRAVFKPLPMVFPTRFHFVVLIKVLIDVTMPPTTFRTVS